MPFPARRRARAGHASWVFSLAVGCAIACATGPVRGQEDAVPPAAVEDDPFADELNPFGKRPDAATEPAPAQPAQPAMPDAVPAAPAPVLPTPGRAPTKPPVQLPVPFPESSVPGEPVPRPPSRRDYRLPGDEAQTFEPTEAEKLVMEAEKLDTAGDLAAARAKLEEAVRIDPKLTIGWLALGVVARKQGDLEASVIACSKGILVDPSVPELYLRRGIAWYHQGLHGIALEDFEEAAGLSYDDPRPELWRGLTLMALDRRLEAINAYAASIRRDRDFLLAYLNRGLAYLAAGEPRKAEFDFDMAIRRDPRDARAWFNRGVALARQERFAEAVNSYDEALKRDPALEAARRNRAAAASRSGRP